MFKATLLLLNDDPVFNTRTWETLDMLPGLEVHIVRSYVEMASTIVLRNYDLLVFDQDTAGNLGTALNFRHHFPSRMILAILGDPPPPQHLRDARQQRVHTLRRSHSPLLHNLRLRIALATIRRQYRHEPEFSSTPGLGYSLVGDMRVFPPADIIQMSCMAGRNGKLTFTSTHGTVEVFLRDGNILHATFQETYGEEAISEVFRWDGGRFYFEEGLPDTPQTIVRSWSHVIVDSLKARDETSALLEGITPGPQ